MTDPIPALIAAIRERGIEARLQHTYFEDQVAVHLYGNDNRASIYSADQFLRWAPTFLASFDSLET